MKQRELSVEKILSVSSRRKILEELIKSGEGTAYELAKALHIPDSAVGKHLKILQEAELVEEPKTDISEGRLRKVYKPSANAQKVLTEFWLEEIKSVPEGVKDSLRRMRKVKEGGN